MKKKPAVVVAVISLLIFATTAPSRAQTVTSPDPSRNGFYIGAEFGGGVGTSRKDFTNGTTTNDFAIAGLLVGATAGYSRQYGNLVLGLEGDFSGSGVKGATSCPNALFTCGTNTSWLATVRPRVGYALGRFMPYATGGLALGDVNVWSGLNTTGRTGVNYTEMKAGWTVGAGVESSIAPNWSFKVEYLYVQLGDTYVPSDVPLINTSTKVNENIVRVGVNYSFK